MVKAKRLANKGFLRDIQYNRISPESEYCYIKAKCLPSMRTNVKVGDTRQISDFYSLLICVVKQTGKIQDVKREKVDSVHM